MFLAVDCPRHGKRVLLSGSSILRLVNGDGGVEVVYRCTCGHEGTWQPR